MNRLSLVFAVLIAASFLGSSPPPGDLQTEGAPPISANKYGQTRTTQSGLQNPSAAVTLDADGFVDGFLKKEQTKLDVLFATVPDPVETHLAAEFDHNLAAIQDGIQDSGYLFDSSWIPWETPQSYDRLEDELLAARLRNAEHAYPGMLLFRRNRRGQNEQDHKGLVVFLLAEKPTAGIALSQVDNAIGIMEHFHYCFRHEIRILGPNFSGSLDSLAPALAHLAKPYLGQNGGRAQAVIRSGGFTAKDAGKDFLLELQKEAPGLVVDLGSANHAFADWMKIAVSRLCQFGIEHARIAILTEDESLFGGDSYNDSCLCSEQRKPGDNSPRRAARISFPRDISALRESYEKQGLLEKNTAGGEVKRYLHLTEEVDKQGDTVREFGGQGTVAAKESVLFGISNFIRSHGILAVIIVATNEEDRYFLTQFIHANNDGVRVVVLGATRLFMRGSTSQFRGDLTISSFPMMSRTYDWTVPESWNPHPVSRTFPDDYSQGNYVAALDLLGWPDSVAAFGPRSPATAPEYAGPPWGEPPGTSQSRTAPPIYLAALGGDASWPVWEEPGGGLNQASSSVPTGTRPGAPRRTGPEKLKSVRSEAATAISHPAAVQETRNLQSELAMPFKFGRHFGVSRSAEASPLSQGQLINTGHLWRILIWFLWAFNGIFYFAVFYSNPVERRKFAFLQPTANWRYWLFAVAIPSLASGCSFLVLAWAHRFPDNVMQGRYRGDFFVAVWSSILAAWGMAVAPIIKFAWPSLRAFLFTQSHDEQSVAFTSLLETWTPLIGCASALLVTGVAITFLILHGSLKCSTGDILNIYREMYWESGLSLVPSALLLLVGFGIWANFSSAGTSLLRESWKLPEFSENSRISGDRGNDILNAGRPVPTHTGAKWYWISVVACSIAAYIIGSRWPSIRALTTLEDKRWTDCMLWLWYAILVCFILDLLQFAWLWAELRDLLEALDREILRRSFVPLREFSWNSLWQFSGGSLQDRRNLLSAQYECLEDLVRDHPDGSDGWTAVIDATGEIFRIREKYVKTQIHIEFSQYCSDMRRLFNNFASVGALFASRYYRFYGSRDEQPNSEKTNGIVVTCCEGTKDRFKEEERQQEMLPLEEQRIERFLCLNFVGFIQTIIVRLRGLACSFVSLFFVLALSVAIYPFQPMQTLLSVGFAMFGAMAVTAAVVYSQMDRDPVLSRVLNSDPTKLEKSFYGKLIETLTLPLLPLLSQLLPGGAGRLVDAVARLLNHGL